MVTQGWKSQEFQVDDRGVWRRRFFTESQARQRSDHVTMPTTYVIQIIDKSLVAS